MKKVTRIEDEYPFRNTPLALTIGNEIKRIADEKGKKIDTISNLLAGFLGVSPRQIYNFRMGKTKISERYILPLCEQFESNAMASAWLAEKKNCELPEGFDLVKIANQSARTILQTHEKYLEAFDDGKISGFEITELKQDTAKAQASLNQLQLIAEKQYLRGKIAA